MAIQVFKIGSIGQDSVVNTKCLYANVIGGAPDYVSFHNGIGTLEYQVTAGYTLFISRIVLTPGGVGNGVLFGYGTEHVDTTEGAPAGETPMTAYFRGVAADNTEFFDVFIPIPAEKYPYALNVGGDCKVTIFGVEVVN